MVINISDNITSKLLIVSKKDLCCVIMKQR